MNLLKYRNHQGLRYSEEGFFIFLLSVMSVLEDQMLTQLCTNLSSNPICREYWFKSVSVEMFVRSYW